MRGEKRPKRRAVGFAGHAGEWRHHADVLTPNAGIHRVAEFIAKQRAHPAGFAVVGPIHGPGFFANAGAVWMADSLMREVHDFGVVREHPAQEALVGIGNGVHVSVTNRVGIETRRVGHRSNRADGRIVRDIFRGRAAAVQRDDGGGRQRRQARPSKTKHQHEKARWQRRRVSAQDACRPHFTPRKKVNLAARFVQQPRPNQLRHPFMDHSPSPIAPAIFPAASTRPRSVFLEGVIAGFIGATTVALWFLIVDALRGRAFLVPASLGHGLRHALGIAGADSFAANVVMYTVVHYIAFFVAGVFAALILRRSATQPAILAGAFLLFVVFEAGFFVLTTVLPESRALGLPSWALVSVANLLAAGAMGVYLWRTHPRLGAELDRVLSGRDGVA